MRLLILLSILACATSCGKLKKNLIVTRENTEVTTEERTKEEIVTTEKADTLITLPADTSSWILPLHELTDSSGLVVESESVVVRFDLSKGRVRTTAIVKPKTVPVQIEKKTEIKRDIRVNTELDRKTFEKEKDVEKTLPIVQWWWWIVLVIFGAAFFYIRYILRVI